MEVKEVKAVEKAAVQAPPAKPKGPKTQCPKCQSGNLPVVSRDVHCPFCGWIGKVSELVEA